jgi:hypothetical protein
MRSASRRGRGASGIDGDTLASATTSGEADAGEPLAGAVTGSIIVRQRAFRLRNTWTSVSAMMRKSNHSDQFSM